MKDGGNWWLGQCQPGGLERAGAPGFLAPPDMTYGVLGGCPGTGGNLAHPAPLAEKSKRVGAAAPHKLSLLRQRREGGGSHFPFLFSQGRCNPSSLPGPRQLFLEPFTRQLEERAFSSSPFVWTPASSLSPLLRLHLGASPWLDLPFLVGPAWLTDAETWPPRQKTSLSRIGVHSFCGTLSSRLKREDSSRVV